MEVAIITAFIGAIATISAALITARAKDKTNAQLEKEITRLRRYASSSAMLSPREYRIKIVSPAEYENVGESFQVNGTCENLPEGQVIWVSTFGVYDDGHNTKRKHYWPQEPANIVHTADGIKWYSKVNNIGGGNTRELIPLQNR